MKKRLLSILLALCMVLGMAPAGTLAAGITSGNCGQSVTWTLEGGVLRINGTEDMYSYVGPDRVPWYSQNTTINSVEIGSGVTSIGNYAFYGCKNLTHVTIPNSITSIGWSAFDSCEKLTSLTIPDSVTEIENYAFYSCTGLTNVTIPNSVTSVGIEVFSGCTGLLSIQVDSSNQQYASVDGVLFDKGFETLVAYPAGRQGTYAIPDSVTTIGEAAFYFAGLTGVIMPDTVTEIGDRAFSFTGMTNVTIGKGVTKIGESAFFCCENLTSASIPNGVTSIGDGAFSGTNLSSVNIPGSVASLGAEAFLGTNLTSVTIPDSVVEIGNGAFAGCESLTSVTIGKGITSIGISGSSAYGVFQGCTGLTNITIPENATNIGGSAFEECTGLTSMSIPDSVTNIEDFAFHRCTNLTNIYYSGSEAKWGAVSVGSYNDELANAVIHYNSTWGNQDEPPAGQPCGENVTYLLENGTLKINGTGNMYDYMVDTSQNTCTAPWFGHTISSIEIGNGVTDIGYNAFYGCKDLISVTIPDSVTLIRGRAFWDCTSLTDITIPGSVTSIESRAFQGCSNLTSVTIHNGVTSIESRAFQGCSNLTSVTIPNSVTYISNIAFYGCTGLTAIHVDPGNHEYTSLDGILLAKNGRTLHIYPCGKQGAYTIPDRVTKIDRSAFEGCTGLTGVTIPDSVTSIGSSAFEGCTGLTGVTIPDSVTSIGSSAFRGCTNLTSIVIPGSITSIDHDAFQNCTNLRDVYFTGTEERWNRIKKGEYGNSKDFRKDLTNVAIHYSYTSSNSTSSGAPIIGSAVLTYNGTDYDIFTQALTIDKDSDVTAFLHIKINDNGCKNVKTYVTQGTCDETEIAAAGENIQPGQLFSAGKTIYILAIDVETGKSTSKATKLKVASLLSGNLDPPSGVDGFNFSLGKDISFTIPDSVPVFGGTEIKWSFDFIPVSVEYDREDNNKLNVVFGTNITEKTSEDDRTYFKDFKFAEYKKDLKKAANKQGRTLKQLRNDYKMTNDIKGSLFGGNLLAGIDGKGKNKVDVAGYAELHYTDKGWQFAEGQLCLNFEFSYTWNGQVFIWVVPLYYKFGGKAGFGLEGDMIDVDPVNYSPDFDAYILGKIGGELGGGVGIVKVASVGADGEATLNLKKSLSGPYFKADVDGSAKFSVKLFGKTVAEKKFAKGNFLIYETGNSNGLIRDMNSASLFSDPAELWESIDLDAVYENEDRTYAAFPTEWYADMPEISLMAADYSHGELRQLSSNIYTESAPQICEIGGQTVMVMQWDTGARADIDRSMLVYSLYDAAADTWSEPVAVYDDGTADFYPCFQNGYLVWQNEKTTLSDSMTLSEIAALGEICICKWNGSGFTAPVALTDDNNLDTLPQVSVNGADVSVVWVTNSEHDILGLSGTSTIMCQHLDGELNLAGSSVDLTSGLNPVTDLAAGTIGGKTCVAYVLDRDNDLNTIEDWEIWLVKDGTPVRLTENTGLDSNPVFAGGKLYYYSMGNIAIVDANGEQGTVFDAPRQGLTDSFVVNENSQGEAAVWWAKTMDSGTELFATLYRNGSWSDEVQITSMDAKVRYPSGLLRADGSMLAAFSCAAVEDNSVMQTDLYTVSLTPAYDLELLDATFDEDTMTAYATVRNSGELELPSYCIELLDNGTVNNTVTVDTPLKAGESTEIELPYKMGTDMSLRTVSLQASTTAGEEYNTENNAQDFTVGHADVAVEAVTVSTDGTTVSAEVSNTGHSTAENIWVQLRKDTADGTVLAEQSISLAPEEKQTLEFSLDRSTVKGGQGEVQLYVTAAIEDEEVSLGNNDSYVFVAAQPDHTIEILAFREIEGKTMVNSYAGNNTDSPLSCVIYTAVYSSAGKMKGCGSSSATVGAGNDIGVDIRIPCSVDSGDIIKTFMLDTSMRPLISCSDYVNN